MESWGQLGGRSDRGENVFLLHAAAHAVNRMEVEQNIPLFSQPKMRGNC